MPTITPPGRLDRILRAGSYFLLGYSGFWVIFLRPEMPTTSVIGSVIRPFWAIFIMTAFVAAVAAFRGRYRPEYICLPFISIAMLLADIAVWIAAHNDPARTFQALVFTIFTLHLVIRFVSLHRIVSVKGDKSWIQ